MKLLSFRWQAGLLSLAFSLVVAGASPGAERPNILLVLTDDHRWDTMGCAGHPFVETPNMDRLAKEGVYFENAFVTTSLCSPSRASILTGQYAHRHGVVDNYHAVREDLVFFPQLLQEEGYDTAFVGKWHMGGDTDEPQRGFDYWLSFKGQGVYFSDPADAKVKGRYVPQVSRDGFNINGKKVPQTGYITDELTDYAVDWLRQRKGGRSAEAETDDNPFFLYVSHKAVHADFLPANRHAYRYEEKPFERPLTWVEDESEFSGLPVWVRNQRNSRHGVEFAYYSELDLATYYRRYCESLLAVDESLGRLMEELETAGELDSTLILYLGDNGFLFGEHGLIDKRCAYEESMRIPMLARWPEGLEKPHRVDEMVANIDVGPTLLDAAGVPAGKGMDGQSFLPLMRSREPGQPWREQLLYEYYWERNYPQTPTTHAVRDADGFKYIRYYGVWDTDELYDLNTDPKERRNLIADPAHAERVTRMNRQLFEKLQATDGMQLPLLEDRGTKFLHRKSDGGRAVDFPDRFYEMP